MSREENYSQDCESLTGYTSNVDSNSPAIEDDVKLNGSGNLRKADDTLYLPLNSTSSSKSQIAQDQEKKDGDESKADNRDVFRNISRSLSNKKSTSRGIEMFQKLHKQAEQSALVSYGKKTVDENLLTSGSTTSEKCYDSNSLTSSNDEVENYDQSPANITFVGHKKLTQTQKMLRHQLLTLAENIGERNEKEIRLIAQHLQEIKSFLLNNGRNGENTEHDYRFSKNFDEFYDDKYEENFFDESSIFNGSEAHCDDHENHYDDHRNRYDDHENHYDDQRNHYDDQASHYDDHRNHYDDQASHYDDHGSHFELLSSSRRLDLDENATPLPFSKTFVKIKNPSKSLIPFGSLQDSYPKTPRKSRLNEKKSLQRQQEQYKKQLQATTSRFNNKLKHNSINHQPLAKERFVFRKVEPPKPKTEEFIEDRSQPDALYQLNQNPDLSSKDFYRLHNKPTKTWSSVKFQPKAPQCQTPDFDFQNDIFLPRYNGYSTAVESFNNMSEIIGSNPIKFPPKSSYFSTDEEDLDEEKLANLDYNLNSDFEDSWPSDDLFNEDLQRCRKTTNLFPHQMHTSDMIRNKPENNKTKISSLYPKHFNRPIKLEERQDFGNNIKQEVCTKTRDDVSSGKMAACMKILTVGHDSNSQDVKSSSALIPRRLKSPNLNYRFLEKSSTKDPRESHSSTSSYSSTYNQIKDDFNPSKQSFQGFNPSLACDAKGKGLKMFVKQKKRMERYVTEIHDKSIDRGSEIEDNDDSNKCMKHFLNSKDQKQDDNEVTLSPNNQSRDHLTVESNNVQKIPNNSENSTFSGKNELQMRGRPEIPPKPKLTKNFFPAFKSSDSKSSTSLENEENLNHTKAETTIQNLGIVEEAKSSNPKTGKLNTTTDSSTESKTVGSLEESIFMSEDKKCFTNNNENNFNVNLKTLNDFSAECVNEPNLISPKPKFVANSLFSKWSPPNF